jgi:hypothetical protein
VVLLKANLQDANLVRLPDREQFHIYLLMGQSNMCGRDHRPEPLSLPIGAKRIWVMDEKGGWALLKEPIHHIGDQAGKAGIGPGSAFALSMAKANPEITIGLMPLAVGGSPLASWEEDAQNYQRAKQYATLPSQQGVIKGLLWHQGESDSGNSLLAETYAVRMEKFIRSLRHDIGAPELSVVLVELGTYLHKRKNSDNIFPYWKTINKQLALVSGRLNRTTVVSSTELTDRGDTIHFSAQSADELGRRYARAIHDHLRLLLDSNSGQRVPFRRLINKIIVFS